jgi:hypothetical protein
MLVACRLAGLSALGEHNAGVKWRATPGRRSRSSRPSWAMADIVSSCIGGLLARRDGKGRRIPGSERRGS